MNKNAELKDMSVDAFQRSIIYGFLARVYRKELTLDMLVRIKDSRFTEVLSDLGVQLGDGFYAKPDEELLEDLAIEYTGLFLGPGRHISPHESIHYERDDGDWGKHWGASTVEVKKFVESLGLQYKESDTSIPDHISVELELMQKIISKEKEAWEKNDGKGALHYLKIEKMFMDDHIIQWVPRFCDEITANAELSFYREMAGLTKNFIQVDMNNINRYIAEAR